jgi:murein DD-endopeptidase MepM/ murein hydrolase activator NlpD
MPTAGLLLVVASCLPSPGLPPGSHGPSAAVWQSPLPPPVILLRAFAPPPASAPWLAGHRGVDLGGMVGMPVRADGPGRITLAAAVAGTPVVVVDHGGGLRSTFEPVLPLLPTGSPVRAGEVVGRLGSWPVRSRAVAAVAPHCGVTPCLHWGMLRDGWYVDPLLTTGLGAGCRSVRLLPLGGPAVVRPLGATSPTVGGAGPAPVSGGPVGAGATAAPAAGASMARAGAAMGGMGALALASGFRRRLHMRMRRVLGRSTARPP